MYFSSAQQVSVVVTLTHHPSSQVDLGMGLGIGRYLVLYDYFQTEQWVQLIGANSYQWCPPASMMTKTQPRSNIEWDKGPAQLTLPPERDMILKFFRACELLWECGSAK